MKEYIWTDYYTILLRGNRGTPSLIRLPTERAPEEIPQHTLPVLISFLVSYAVFDIYFLFCSFLSMNHTAFYVACSGI